MEFIKLQAMNDNFGKPKWQKCDNITAMSVGPANEWKSPQGKTFYYYPLSVMTEAGVAVEAQLAKEDNSPVAPGDMAVECQVKWDKGKLKYQFRPAKAQQSPTNSQQAVPQHQSRPANDPDTTARIIRGNAVNACGACCNDPATFWSMLPFVQRYIETGEMPSA